MASAKSLEEMLSSDVDESAISALVGSLESQLASPTIHVTSQDISSTSVTNNHINNSTVMDTFVNRIHHQSDGQKHGILNSAATAQTTTNNSVITNSDSTKTLVSSAPLTSITPSTTVQANTYTVTLPGALPASGYINQFQTVSVPTASTAGILQRTTTIPNGNASGTGAIAAALTAPKTSVAGMGTTVTANKAMATKPGTPIPVTSTNVTVNLSGIGAMQNLANVAARQQPLVIPTSQHQHAQGQAPQQTIQGHPTQTVIAVAKSTASQVLTAAGHTTSVAGTAPPVNMVTQVVSNPQILQGVQIVNVNPLRAGTPTTGQKTLAPRVVIGSNPVRIAAGPQVIGTRPGVPGGHGPVQNTITLQPGMVRGTLLVKTENGQYQLVNVGPPLTPGTSAGTVPGNTTYRIQTMPPGTQAPVRALPSQQLTVTLPVSHANQHIKVQQPQQAPQMVHTVLAQQPAVSMVSSAPIAHTTTHTAVASPSVVHQVGVRGSSVVAVQPATQPHTVAITVAPSPVTVIASTTPTPTLVTSITSSTTSTTAAGGIQGTTAPQMSPDTAKKKCKNFLSTLLRLASDQPDQVATNVKNLIQGLIDGVVPPEDFTNQLQKELNSSPQPCLIPFLKKSLPYLRHSLTTKELSIEGVRPPPVEVSTLPPTPTIIPQIQLATATRPTLTQPGSQVRLITTATPPSTLTTQIPHSSIGDLTATANAQRLAAVSNVCQISAPQPRLFQKPSHMKSPFHSNFPSSQHQPGQRFSSPLMTSISQANNVLTATGSVRPVVCSASSLSLTQAVVAGLQRTASTPPTRMATIVVGSKASTIPPAPVITAIASMPSITTTVNTTVASSITPATSIMAKEKEKRSYSSTLKDDDDINDVAAMGGVNLVEESARIMAQNAEFVGTQIRSCKDENFLFTAPLQRRIRSIAAKYGLDEPPPEVAAIVSHATQERLKDMVEKLGVIAEHRLDVLKSDPKHETTQDVKGQLKFLEELDKLEKKRHEEQEREMLLRAAKSRSKLEDPEQLKLKQKAKEMQRAEQEEMRQREANMTALLAIGPRKKFKTDMQSKGSNGQQAGGSAASSSGMSNFNMSSSRPQISRPRVKRVHLRDLVYLMEQEHDTCHSVALYRAFLK